ncbi:hypothetical protein ASPZODRAFT_26444 [Penicilliopsis zonata CBS 506.65]|uniref:SAM-dependent MTase RsmB/NOP-type domain-containing protein n=1 Tax=Penicilliopsis zonata CBS 506.65 TaxID=1073090 RepID=A0A1L9SEZ0_9EURO|nr:hypothetical protein ASPZODRAFT_26444 [Penicilliopsis zonata CBS 506.65]OJJ45835.1 hypothetical protein ASPZODRAFT_26444 [Penicilliopsis zonata CBS 506.65]
MSLYYDAVTVLTAPSSTGGSFKSRVYNARNIKATPAQIYALIIEASKWDLLLKEVIERSDLLKHEHRLTPLLALLLVHDHLVAKGGIAAPVSHPLRQAVERHKTRLKAEFVKARVRRGCASIQELKSAVLKEKKGGDAATTNTTVYPRWVRINNIRSSLEEQLKSTFAAYTRVTSLAELGDKTEKKLYVDVHIPDLVAVAYGTDFSTAPAYKNGEIILQDKASCFPAYLLAGNGWAVEMGGRDLIDGCAAPGNKTTHLASLLAKEGKTVNLDSTVKSHQCFPHIYSMDASPNRSKTLQKMVSLAGADSVTVLPGQDFLALDPADPRFATVTGLLLDPSCSGSGIIGREDVPTLTLPEAVTRNHPQGKKRKRGQDDQKETSVLVLGNEAETETENELSGSSAMDPDRLAKLSNLQARIVEHALRFPAATHVTYSTCSIHGIENEDVVARVLASDPARDGGWRVMTRGEQPAGLQKWGHRGVQTERGGSLSVDELEGCLRCWPGDEQGLGGFFVVGFVRESKAEKEEEEEEEEEEEGEEGEEGGEGSEEEEWEGFSD